VDGGDHRDIAAATAVAAAGASARDVLLAPKSQAAVAAIARFDGDSYFIYKHKKAAVPSLKRFSRPETGTSGRLLINRNQLKRNQLKLDQ
jgi:hypothetical protein